MMRHKNKSFKPKTENMKLFIIALGILFSTATTNAFAVDSKTIPSIIKNFSTKFKDATDVKWSNTEDFLIIEFKQKDKINYAYYNESSELVVLATPVTISELKPSLQKELSKRYSDFTISDLFILKDGTEVKYSAVLMNQAEKLILSSTGSKWQVIKKVKN